MENVTNMKKTAGAIEIGDTYLDHLNRPRKVIRTARSIKNMHITDELGNNIYAVGELLETVLPYKQESEDKSENVDIDFTQGLSC